jgi:hypothetical protein
MSRNQNRLGIEEEKFLQDETPAPFTGQESGPAFNWSVPTELVELPSKGLFYPANHPLHKQETVEIRYMTAKEEDLLTSRALLREGVALDRMLANLLVDRSIDIGTLLLGDKNALLVAARRTGYGPEYETSVTCPSCEEKSEFSFDISEPKSVEFEEQANAWGVSYSDEGHVNIKLPMTKAVVTCRLLTSEDEVRLAKELQRKEKKKITSSSTTDTLRAIIVAVNGDSDRVTLESFIQAMPARDGRTFRMIYGDITPNIDLTQFFECGNCGHGADLEVPLGIDFFWPG